ncbi:hypothetical protein J7E96_17080 [Streptomyces sp. ISL-96]|uniref:hypothetical protein n=1 Tax=Streptomyces sp. ISL-96 TaxID=2819191 RepID=UPI001BE902FC|nr:hypothetical protein [Streptomyces sp. ISL-96]MBT2490201.1 hypothetical protein [Streptomyces sp. ISL-96]
MTEQDKNTKSKPNANNTTARAASRTTASRTNGKASDTAGTAKAAANDATAKASDTAGTAKAAAADTTAKATDALGSAKAAGIKGVEVSRQALDSAAGKVASTASTAWVLLNARKAVIAGASAGAVAIGAASFVAGRKAEQRSLGPVTRLLAGRI